MGIGHLGDERLVRKRHWQSGDRILLESLVKISKGLSGLNLESVIDETGLAVSLTYFEKKNVLRHGVNPIKRKKSVNLLGKCIAPA